MNTEEKTIDGKTYWKTAKACQYMGVSKNTLRSLAQKKMVTHVRLCGQIFFLKEWLDAYISRSTVIGNGR